MLNFRINSSFLFFVFFLGDFALGETIVQNFLGTLYLFQLFLISFYVEKYSQYDYGQDDDPPIHHHFNFWLYGPVLKYFKTGP